MKPSSRGVAKWVWCMAMVALGGVWLTTVNLGIAGLDARYYFTAADLVGSGQNPYLSGDYLYPSFAAWLLGLARANLSADVVTIGFNALIASSILMLAVGMTILAGLHPWSRRAPGVAGSYYWLGLVTTAVFLFSGVTETVMNLGNISPVIGALCVWAGILYVRNRPFTAATLVALATVLKLVPAPLLAFMFMRGARRRDRSMIAASVIGTLLVLTGILVPPFATEFMHSAGGATKWGIDIGGACVSVHVWLARAFDNGFINHPDIAFIVFAAATAGAALYGWFSRAPTATMWLTVMLIANIASPKNCPHLFMAMTFGLFVLFTRHMADLAATHVDRAAVLLRLIPAIALPMLAASSEFFYFRGHPVGTLVLPLIPPLAGVVIALELNSNRPAPTLD